MSLDHRLVMAPHGGSTGSLLGSERDFERYCAYWGARIAGGVQWVGGGPTFVRNPLVPGFEPTGVGAFGPGFFRHPRFVERLGAYMERLHAAGGFGSVQFVLQGAMPLAPSPTLSGYADHKIPHVMSPDEVAWMVREYGESAALAAEGGTDAIELHSNHDDLLQWFLSPLTNQRTDGYGGSFENRRRFLREVVESIRDHVNRPITLGLRLCLDEMIEGGYRIDECQQLLAAFTADGTVDYFSLDVGNNWGEVSYIPPGAYGEASWAELCGQAKQATDLPVIYVGRVLRPATAEQVLAGGHADLVGFVRALIAEPALVGKARDGVTESIRPCLGVNECIDRRVVEGLEFACASNPLAGREIEGQLPPAETPRSVLVIGGGPAGTELAALCAGRGHLVALWEREGALGGQLAIAALARANQQYGDWIRWQERRLGELDIDVQLGREATVASIEAAGADVVVMATGAIPRRPDVPGIDLPLVRGAGEVLRDGLAPGRTLVVSEDDRAAPLAVADHLASLGHQVTLTYRTTAPSPLVGKYTVGAYLSRLDAQGVTMVPMARVTAIEPGLVHLAHTYSGRSWSLEGFDHVVLACGAIADDALFQQVRLVHPEVHVLGDAYAPRRVAYATRQAWALAATLS
jgi:2,4-dienoyl-CoA reductase-like NADH-dependent reductase (Old Yellow Enzyme family)/thioredoxin reductase